MKISEEDKKRLKDLDKKYCAGEEFEVADIAYLLHRLALAFYQLEKFDMIVNGV